MLYQQGDVLLETFSGEPPESAKPTKMRGKGFVLAEGEATGHAHVLEGPGVAVMECGEEMFAKIDGEVPAVLKHEEHKPVTVAPGTYKVRAVQEFDHFAQQARDVVD